MAFVLVTGILLPRIASGELSVGVMFAVVLYGQYMVKPVHFIGNAYTEFRESMVNVRRLHNLLTEDVQVVELPGAQPLTALCRSLRLEAVTYVYPDTKKGLHNVTLEFPRGKTTAIVGRSGAGKSTIAQLLTRCFDPGSGHVWFDDIDLRLATIDSIYAQIVYFAQEEALFAGSVRENVMLGCPGSSDDAVLDALRRASADFVADLPLGLDYDIGEGGGRLSGGQRQRISIARVLMRRPSVFILDEATSGLDTKTEHEVMAAFTTLSHEMSGLTKVVIAHRLSTVKRADQIIVIDNGQVLAKGTHSELLATCELYQELHGTDLLADV